MTFEKNRIVLYLLLFSLLVLAGCSKEADQNGPSSAAGMGTVDTTKPISEIQAGAETMGNDDLKAAAIKYKEAILDKKDEIKDLAIKIKEIPMSEILGQEAKAIKTEAKNLEDAVTDLTTRFQVYYDALKEKGGSLSGLEL